MGDVQSVREYQQFHFATNGDSVAHLDGSKAADARLLRRVHEALVQFHKEALDAAGATAQVEALRPDSGILSIWDQRADGFENACHKPKAQGLNGEGIDPVDIPPTALQPFAKVPNLFLANEAYGTLECFAEGSLVMSENIARRPRGTRPKTRHAAAGPRRRGRAATRPRAAPRPRRAATTAAMQSVRDMTKNEATPRRGRDATPRAAAASSRRRHSRDSARPRRPLRAGAHAPWHPGAHVD